MKGLSKEEEELLFKDLSQRLCYKVKCNVYGRIGTLTGLNDYGAEIDYGNGEDTTCEIQYCLPYLRPMSSMTKEEKKDLLVNIVGNKGSKYFQVLSDGSIDNTDATIQDPNTFNIHWVNFDKNTVTLYLDWLNKNHFDYLNLIEKNLALKASRDMYKHKLINYDTRGKSKKI